MLYCSTKFQEAGPAERHIGKDAFSGGNTDENLNEEPLGRQSTNKLAELNANYTYEVPRVILRKIMKQDACSMFGIPGGWPKKFSPLQICGLFGEELGEERRHSGQRVGLLAFRTECIPECGRICENMQKSRMQSYEPREFL